VTLEIVFLAASALLQLVAILLALRLIKTTGAREVWLILAAALGMMMIQRLVLLAGVTFPGASPRFLPELVSLAASLLILFSIFSIQSLFRERQRDEETLRESEQRYHFLADAMPQIVWTARLDGNLDYYNQRWFDYTGLTARSPPRGSAGLRGSLAALLYYRRALRGRLPVPPRRGRRLSLASRPGAADAR
jgi:PAS domain-containing protein